MALIANVSSVILTQSIKTTIPMGWAHIMRGQNFASGIEFVKDFHFDATQANMFVETTTNDQGIVIRTKRTIFLWVGEKKNKMEQLIWNGTSNEWGGGLSLKDINGNLFTCFAVLLVHTETPRTTEIFVRGERQRPLVANWQFTAALP